MALTGEMRSEPRRSAAMAGFAADPVRNLELRSLLGRWDVVGVTVKAERGLGRVRDPEILGDALGTVVAQYRVGLGVLILLRPGEIFVLRHPGMADRLHRAVAVVAGAALHAEMRRVVGDRGCGNRKKCGDDGRGEEPRHRRIACCKPLSAFVKAS